MDFFDNITKTTLGGVGYIEVKFNGVTYKLNISLFHNFKTSLELFNSGNVRLALEKMLNVKKQSVNNSSIDYVIGFIYEELQDYDNAISYYKLSNNECNCFWIEFRIGLCLYHIKKYNEAINFYSSVLSEEFTDFQDHIFQSYTLNKSIVYNNRGLCYAMVGESQSCIIDCTKSIELKPDYENPYFVRGIEYYKNGFLEQARKDIIKSKELGNPNANNLLSQIEVAQNEHLTKIKTFATSSQAIQLAGGQRLSDAFIGDLRDLVSKKNPQTYSELKSIIKSYSREMWVEFKKNAGSIDYFNKTFIAYEVVFAITKIYNNIPFEEFYYSILD